jgi:hypothetical protein
MLPVGDFAMREPWYSRLKAQVRQVWEQPPPRCDCCGEHDTRIFAGMCEDCQAWGAALGGPVVAIQFIAVPLPASSHKRLACPDCEVSGG